MYYDAPKNKLKIGLLLLFLSLFIVDKKYKESPTLCVCPCIRNDTRACPARRQGVLEGRGSEAGYRLNPKQLYYHSSEIITGVI